MRRLWLAMTLALVGALVAIPAATTAVGANSSALRQAVTVNGLLAHEQAFMSHANASIPQFGYPTRVDGSVGFTESVNYVASKMSSYGYNVTVQNFTFDRFVESAPPVFAQVSPNATTYVEGTDFLTMEYSGAGDVTAAVVPTNDFVLPPVGGSTSGCELADFPATVAGKIALIQRGTCTFRQKAENAAAKGAIGVVIFNEGNSPDRVDVINGTLSPPQMSLPVIGTTFAAYSANN